MKNKISTTRLVYSFLDYFNNLMQTEYDISSYYINANSTSINFIGSKLQNYIAQHSKKNATNKLFITLSINDSKSNSMRDSKRLLNEVLEKFNSSFWNSNILDMLELYEPDATIKIFSKDHYYPIQNYLIVIVNLPQNLSIEIVVSTNKMSKRLIEKDESGIPIEYHSSLAKNIKLFDEERKKL